MLKNSRMSVLLVTSPNITMSGLCSSNTCVWCLLIKVDYNRTLFLERLVEHTHTHTHTHTAFNTHSLSAGWCWSGTLWACGTKPSRSSVRVCPPTARWCTWTCATIRSTTMERPSSLWHSNATRRFRRWVSHVTPPTRYGSIERVLIDSGPTPRVVGGPTKTKWLLHQVPAWSFSSLFFVTYVSLSNHT